MKIFKLSDMKNGWFIGDFEPAVFKNKNFEVGFHQHKKNDITKNHYHKNSTEFNVIIKGKMKVNGLILSTGDIFVFEPYTISESFFLEDTELIVVRNGSGVNDKFYAN